MKGLFDKLDKAFEHRVRLGIMSLLAIQDDMPYTELKQQLDLTDGNLATHMRTLLQAGYVNEEKKFANRKPLTSYTITPEGREAFMKHLEALEALLKSLE